MRKETKPKVDFIGAGDQKSATTWIFQCLSEHPDICTSSTKETRFFDDDVLYEKGLGFYGGFFSHCSGDKVIGEYSPSYIHSKEAPERIKEHYPDVKLIFSLRNPVEKSYSAYWFNKVGGRGSMTIYDSFEEALENAPALIEDNFHYKHLKRYFNLFDRDQILVMIYEDLDNDPKAFIREIYDFVGVDSSFMPPTLTKKVNATGDGRLRFPSLFKIITYLIAFTKRLGINNFLKRFINKERFLRFWNSFGITKGGEKIDRPEISKETRTKLTDIYRHDVESLEELTGSDLSHWK